MYLNIIQDTIRNKRFIDTDVKRTWSIFNSKCCFRLFPGEAGGWRKVLTKDQKAKFEDWIEKNCHHKEILYYILNA